MLFCFRNSLKEKSNPAAGKAVEGYCESLNKWDLNYHSKEIGAVLDLSPQHMVEEMTTLHDLAEKANKNFS